jgi:ABC-2 type transport system ATP-binding protein
LKQIVETRNLTKVYNGKIRAVDNVSIDIGEGEIFGLLGPNGAGKTTMIRMMVTLTRPTSGSVLVAGSDVVKEARKVREIIGYSSQEAGVDEQATGRGYLTLFGHFYGLDGQTIRRRVDEVLALLELTDAADRLTGTYSGGMRKRLEIATALINKPKLLVLDEPTLGLDIQTRARIWDHIRALNSDGMSILLTTHYLEEADKLCDRVAIIDYGRIVVMGTPNALKGEIHGDVVSLTLPPEEPDQWEKTFEKVRQLLADQPLVREIQPTNDGLNVYVDQRGAAVPLILHVVEDAGVVIEDLSLSRASLDDVFIKYTGRTMREERGQALGARKTWFGG